MAVVYTAQNSKMAKDSQQNTITSVECLTSLMFHSCYIKPFNFHAPGTALYTFTKLLETSDITCITLAST